MDFNTLLRFIETELSALSKAQPDSIPPEIADLLRTKFLAKHGLIETVAREVYDVETQWRIQEARRVMESVGDVPASLVQLEHEGTSVEQVIQGVRQLPRLEPLDNTQEFEHELLAQYEVMKDRLLEKCEAIERADSQLHRSEAELGALRQIVDALAKRPHADEES